MIKGTVSRNFWLKVSPFLLTEKNWKYDNIPAANSHSLLGSGENLGKDLTVEEKKLVVRIRNMTFVESLRNRCDG